MATSFHNKEGIKMKASLPFKYIKSKKREKYYVVFDFRDDDNKRQRKWVGTGLSTDCNEKILDKRIDEIVVQFFKDYCSGKLKKPAEKLSKSEINLELLKTAKGTNSSEYQFNQFLIYWLETIKPTIAQNSYESYSVVIKKIIDYFDENYPNLLIRDLTALHIQQFYNDKFNSGLTANTIKHYHANIHKALKYAVKMDIISSNPSEKTDLPKLKKFQAGFYNAKELDEMFTAFKGDRLELVVNIAAYYGLRRSEVLGLKWDCVDFDRKTITIRRKMISRTGNGHEEIIVEEQLKTKSSIRTLPMIPYIEEKLKERYFYEQHYSHILKGNFDRTYDGFVCRDNLGKIITPDYVSQHFAIVLKNANLRHIGFHDLRHSCASLLLANGVSMKAIQEWLGHSTFNVTADFYSHLDYNSKISSAEAIAKAFSSSADN